MLTGGRPQGVPPATLAEFNLGAGGTDFYDGSPFNFTILYCSTEQIFSIPRRWIQSTVNIHMRPRLVLINSRMRIDNNVGCGIPSCPVDLGPNCRYKTEVQNIAQRFHPRPCVVEGSIRLYRFPRRLQERVQCGCPERQCW